MSGADATAWASTVSGARYSGFGLTSGPEWVVCGRCGAAVLNGNTLDSGGVTINAVMLHDSWHTRVDNGFPVMDQTTLIANVLTVVKTVLPDMIATALEDALKAAPATPIEHEPGPVLPGVKRAQPDFTVLKES